MKCLLLGGNGFIGQKLIQKVLSGHEIIIADRVCSAELDDDPKIKFTAFDFIKDDFFPLLDGVDVVFHLISTVFPVNGTENLSDEISANLLPTIRLLDAMAVLGKSRLIFFSSGGTIYGEENNFPIGEKASPQPVCKYGVHKLAIEKYIHLYNVYHDLDYRIIRLSNPYSSKVFSKRLQGVIPIFIEKIYKGEPIAIWGDGNTKRDYIHINDAVFGVKALMDYTGPEKIFNVGTEVSVSLNELITLIVNIMGYSRPTVNYLPGRKCDVTENRLDISLIKQCTEWAPAVSLSDGIKMCIKERMKNDN